MTFLQSRLDGGSKKFFLLKKEVVKMTGDTSIYLIIFRYTSLPSKFPTKSILYGVVSISSKLGLNPSFNGLPLRHSISGGVWERTPKGWN